MGDRLVTEAVTYTRSYNSTLFVFDRGLDRERIVLFAVLLTQIF